MLSKAMMPAAAALGLLAAAPLAAQTEAAIRPGMTEAEVRAAWGEPAAVRTTGDMGYLYYTNDCGAECGTDDVVFLERGQVVDAIVRDSNRRYDGVSSSPPDRLPEFTRPAPGAATEPQSTGGLVMPAPPQSTEPVLELPKPAAPTDTATHKPSKP